MKSEDLRLKNVSEICELVELQAHIIKEQSETIEQLANIIVEMSEEKGGEVQCHKEFH